MKIYSDYSKRTSLHMANNESGINAKPRTYKSGGFNIMRIKVASKLLGERIRMKKTNLAYVRIIETEDYGINKAIEYLNSINTK